jgi:hypothetical protein
MKKFSGIRSGLFEGYIILSLLAVYQLGNLEFSAVDRPLAEK